MTLDPAIKAIVLDRTRYGAIKLGPRFVEALGDTKHEHHLDALAVLRKADDVLEVFPGARLLAVRSP